MDGTENKQDTSATQDTSADTKGTSEQIPKTFTEEEHKKGISDALSKAGRSDKALKARETAVKAEEDRQAQWRREREEEQSRRDAEELERYKDDPDKMDVVKERQANRKMKADLEKEKTDHNKWWEERQADVEASNDAKLEIAVFDVAQEHGVDAQELKDALTELGIESPTKEQIESIAKRMAKSGETDGKTTTTSLKPDSGKTKGGGSEPKTADEKLTAGFAKLNKK